jgi:lipopolysaccharide transport system permease protein
MSRLNPITHVRALHDIISLLTSHRQLTWEMTKKELTDRYAGQVFGTIWILGHPLIMVAVYIFLFVIVYRARIPAELQLQLDMTAYLLTGLLPWMAFQEAMGKASTAILNESSLVKQVVFPIEILPVKGVIVSLITQILTMSLLLAYIALKCQTVHLTTALLPVLVIFQTMAMIGVSYLLSSIGVFFRDLKDFVQVFCFAGIFLMPILYLPVQVPTIFRPILYLNPFSYMVWCYQDAIFFGRFEHWWAWPIFIFGSVAIFYIGYGIFYKLKHIFGNVL